MSARRRWRVFLGILALARTLPPQKYLRVLLALGEGLAQALPFNRDLSFAIDGVVRLQEEEDL